MHHRLKVVLDRLFLRLGYVPAGSHQGCTCGRNDRKVARRPQHLVDAFVAKKHARGRAKACTLRDLSLIGARIDLWDDPSPSLATEPLTLFLPCDNREVDCEVAWIKNRSLGLRFRSGFHEPTRSYGT